MIIIIIIIIKNFIEMRNYISRGNRPRSFSPLHFYTY